jgi:tetratricopeptide (TPR) repeat protein
MMMVRFILIFLIFIFIFYGEADSQTVSILLPRNISGDKDIEWISRTFGRAFLLEVKKEGKFKVELIEDTKNFSDSDFVAISSFKKSKDGKRIIFYMNILSKEGNNLLRGEKYSLIESFSFAFLPELTYEMKTYISRIMRLYIAGSARPESKFNPIKYNFSQDVISKISKTLSSAGERVNSEELIFSPEEVDKWFNLGAQSISQGKIDEGISYILRFVAKKGPEFTDEKELLEDERIKKVGEVLKLALPGTSKSRDESVKLFLTSQFYRDFSENEMDLLSTCIENDMFMWPASKRLGEILFARGDYKRAAQILKDYISSANESFDFILNFSKVISLVDDLGRGF